MRGSTDRQPAMFFAIDLDARVRPKHPLRPIKVVVDQILSEMNPLFEAAYPKNGRPSIPPEALLKLMLLQALYGIASEAQLVERLDTDLLFRWFCGMDPAEPIFDPTAFSHNRQRFLDHALTGEFFTRVTQRAIDKKLVSEEHFSVDGTLIQSYASMKSFVPNETADAIEARRDDDDDSGAGDLNGFKPRNAEMEFHGQKRSNQTHRSPVDPDAKLYRKGKGKPSVLGLMGHIVVDNRSGIVVGLEVTQATGTAECDAALTLVGRIKKRHGLVPKTLGADAGYDSGPFMLSLEAKKITPHVALARDSKPGGVCRRTKADRPKIAARLRNYRRQRGDARYAVSQRKRKKVEEPFGWFKSFAGLRKARLVGLNKIQQQWEIAAAGLTLIRMRNQMA